MSKKGKITFWLFVISILYAVFFMHPTLWRDESFTMALVKHSYSEIIDLDSMDVHPPFYYIVLKFYLSITTFWTSSLFIKVIFARVLSYIITLLSFIVLGKTAKSLNVIGGNALQWAGLFLAPSIMHYATQVRMYALAALLLALLLNQLQHYDNSHKPGHIILAVIFASLASYTHYFAAVSAGWLLILYFVKFVFQKYDTHSLKVSIGLFVGMFVPWGIVAYFQVQSVAKNYWIPPMNVQTFLNDLVNLFTDLNTQTSFDLWAAIALMVLCIYPIVWSYFRMPKKFNLLFSFVMADFMLTAMTGLLVSLLFRPIYLARYGYPIYFIFIFFIVVIIGHMLSESWQKSISRVLNYIYGFLLSILIATNVGLALQSQIVNYDLRTFNLIESVDGYKDIPRDTINLNPNQSPNAIAQKIVYLDSINKKAKIKNFEIKHLFGNDNRKLFHGTFDNVEMDDIE
ncbi:hypothetical protein DY138_04610 [Apilactobacillus timberlakei]|uniref:hypothetical protein n=1 Tax=Apilactobacillus timberlakei TaxID=2008380 RepID=UPI00112D67DF|nr:hypothetical protein [Apilactobacillus timberlakei]TPR18901.1 hypothetical protein DY138_04610 [Apilactobacillus timberlakei]TPR20935.1 hypothetical protein DY061_02530 [Apilactobacillus timberlakei]TPR23586.1 hypothetical protein DY083_00400 [Apilactobacillus timberlakei]